MEHEKIENMDIEKTKELFAYEMTEVLLNLKGEFAAVSGKNTKYSQVALEQEKLRVECVEIPEVATGENRVSPPAVSKMEAVSIPDAAPVRSAVCMPSVPEVAKVCIPEIPCAAPAELPAEASGKTWVHSLDAVRLPERKLPDLPQIRSFAETGKLPDKSEKKTLTAQEVADRTPDRTAQIARLAQQSSAAIEKPLGSIRTVAVPQTPEFSNPEIPPVRSDAVKADTVSVPQIPAVSALTMELPGLDVAAPALPQTALAGLPENAPVSGIDRQTLLQKLPVIPSTEIPVYSAPAEAPRKRSKDLAAMETPAMPDVAWWKQEILSSISG